MFQPPPPPPPQPEQPQPQPEPEPEPEFESESELDTESEPEQQPESESESEPESELEQHELESEPEPQPQPQPRAPNMGNGYAIRSATLLHSLRADPLPGHNSENYDDLELNFSPLVFSNLESYLPANMINASRESKVKYILEILLRYSPESERIRIQKHKEYRHAILMNYPPLYEELYTMDAESFFVPSFLEAIRENTEASFRSIVSQPAKGIYTFGMLQPEFCQMLIEEVVEFERWAKETKFSVMRPSTLNQYGVVLDDFGMETMLDRLMIDFIRPLARVFFREVGGSSLDTHHGFVVEYGTYRDLELGFHVDDCEVSLNVCLGTEFTGGDLYFRGVRCDEHMNTDTLEEEIFEYSHLPGQAVLHAGRHRHGARPTTSGYRINLILWCRSSAFRELKKFQTDFSSWCGECKRLKKERRRISVSATKEELLRRDATPAS